MNDFYAVNISSGEVVKRYYIFGIVILYFKKVCYLTVGLLLKIPAYLDVHLFVTADGNKINFLRLILAYIDIVAFPAQLKEYDIFEHCGEAGCRDMTAKTDALFLSRRNTRISNRRVQQIVEECLKASGLDNRGLSVHKLRHTAATLMYQNGVDVRVLKEVLGHENLNTTQIYTHISNDQMQSAMSKNPLAELKNKK